MKQCWTAPAIASTAWAPSRPPLGPAMAASHREPAMAASHREPAMAASHQEPAVAASHRQPVFSEGAGAVPAASR
eukprot:7780089-Lingulodinium_polyedra.AAC.1